LILFNLGSPEQLGGRASQGLDGGGKKIIDAEFESK